MTQTERKAIRAKAGLLELAKRLGNVTQACRALGYPFQHVGGWSGAMGKADRGQARLSEVRAFLGGVHGDDLHAKPIASLAGATLGVMHAASLAVAMIGQATHRCRRHIPQ